VIVSRNINACWVLILMISQSPSLSRADGLQSTARPLGVYAKVDVEDAISGFTNSASPSTAELHGLVRTLYADLLANPAISGITVGQHWDHIELYDPTNSPDGSAGYDWSYLDDAFAEANAANKSVQLIITPGVDSPPWLLTNIPSCDGLFTNSGIAATNCGTVTFTNFPEMQHSDGHVLPLPWNPVYKAAWQDFLIHLNARYGFNPAFVSIAVAGPVCGSPEMILPTTAYGSTQISGTNADDAWSILITNSFPSISEYQNTDQVFIDQWEQAIEMYEQIFAGVTLCLNPDAGDQFPFPSHNVTPHSDNVLYAMDCLASINSTNKKSNLYQDCLPCEAKTEILSYFARVEGPNGKSTRVGGMTASSPDTLLTGDIGIAGVKLLTSLMPPSPPFHGGAEFDHPVSGDQRPQVGCPDPTNTNCQPTTVEAAYNILTVFFNQTPAAGFYNGTVGTNYIQYLEVPYVDVAYAEANWCPDTNSLTLGSTSLQDLLNRASHDLFAMAGLQLPLPPPTCHSVGPLAVSGTQSQFSFTTNSDGASVTITSYTGGDGALTIPGTLDGLPVTGIGTNAFAGDAMTAVTMPDSLVSIGDGAFAYCFTLTNVSIPDSVTSIGTNSFGGCVKLTAINVDTNNPAYGSVGGILFNKSQTALIQYPGGLGRSYTIPKGVTTIGDAAFDFCQNLRSVTIPNSVTSIGNNAFEDCFSLANVTIGSGVITIGADAFDYCQSLTNIAIPDSVTSIGDGAFEDCFSLTNVTIGSGVTSMGESPFEYCGNLAAINVDMGNTFYSSLDGVLFDKSQTTLIGYPAGNLATSYAIPNSVTNIGDYAFVGCLNLTSVYLEGSPPSLGGINVFVHDNNVTVYYLPGTTGWGTNFAGVPTAPWTPQVLISSSSFGVQTNQFGFDVTWASGMSVVVEVSTDLANGVWYSLATNAITGGSFYFSDPQWTNYSSRFYRVRSR
jgi:BspA type Leucine rich repeat region (6 copies)